MNAQHRSAFAMFMTISFSVVGKVPSVSDMTRCVVVMYNY